MRLIEIIGLVDIKNHPLGWSFTRSAVDEIGGEGEITISDHYTITIARTRLSAYHLPNSRFCFEQCSCSYHITQDTAHEDKGAVFLFG